jgi:hypothetical protein
MDVAIEPSLELAEHDDLVSAVSVNWDGRLLASGSWDCR